MSLRPAIVDTNVVVAGLLSAGGALPVVRIVDGMLAAAFPTVVSQALLAEYLGVLGRPHLRKLHGLTLQQIETLVTGIARHAIVLAPPAAAPAPEPGDQLLWDLLGCRGDLVLVTGDKLLLRNAAMRGRVVSPAAFVADR